MDRDRIAELLQPFLQPLTLPIIRAAHSEPASAGEGPAVLSSAQLQYISTYIDILVRWNARINLSAVRDPDQIVTRHFGESLFAARCLLPGGRAALQGRVSGAKEERAEGAVQDRPSIADVGSGAGFPGLPLKLWAPDISLTLIESNHKKAAFLREVSRALTLTDVNITTARAETLPAAIFQLVTLRAVERFAAVLPSAANLVAPGGLLALLIGSAQFDHARTSLPRFSWSNAQPIPLSRSRVLAVAQRSS